jgi:hypothetical protein
MRRTYKATKYISLPIALERLLQSGEFCYPGAPDSKIVMTSEIEAGGYRPEGDRLTYEVKGVTTQFLEGRTTEKAQILIKGDLALRVLLSHAIAQLIPNYIRGVTSVVLIERDMYTVLTIDRIVGGGGGGC